MNWRSWHKAHAMRAFRSAALRMHVASIALTLLGVASLTAFAAAIPMHNESVANDNTAIFSGTYISGSATQLTNVKKPPFNFQPNSQLDSQSGPGKWIRLCKEGQQCSSADDDIKRRPTFKA
jgi:hypothetical protein